MRQSRNEPCACGSGKKFKHCCEVKKHALPIPDVELNQLVDLFHAGRYAEMECAAHQLTGRFPDLGEAWKLYGVALGVQGKDALPALQRAAQLLPDDVEVQVNLGNVLQEGGQFDAAVASYRRACVLNPRVPHIYNNLGNALKELGQIDAALSNYRAALELDPHYAEAYNNLGTVQQSVGQIEAAVVSYRQALTLHPTFAEAMCNMGNAYRELGQIDAALAAYRQALAINPAHADSHNSLGVALQGLGEFDAALSSFAAALEIKPDHADAHANAAHLLLARGEFEPGWQEYAWRYSRDAVDLPLDDARALLPFHAEGKRILLCFEQGIGDEIFFLRFANQLREQVAWVGYLSTPKVQSLIERSGCVDQVFSRFDSLPSVDITIPVGDLPLLLACNSRAEIPAPLDLRPTEQSVSDVRHRLRGLGWDGQPLLGITWRGGMAPEAGKRKSLFKQIELGLLCDVIKGWHGAIVILQREPSRREIEQLQAMAALPIYDLSDCNDDLESMLALLGLLDQYVGVSNANMHLMAGLGKPAHVLIPFPAEWRWMASGETSAWFPGYSLYRQTADGDWRPALEALARDVCPEGSVLVPPPDPLLALLEAGRYEELESAANARLEESPESGLVWKLLCASLQMQGKDPINALHQTARWLPDDAEVHNNLGRALQDAGQLDDAVMSYRRSLAINPADAAVHNNIGTVLQDLGQFEAAVASYREALKINPDYAEAHNNLGILLQDMGELKGAVASYRRALEINPQYAEAHNNLAHVLLELGDFACGWREYAWRTGQRTEPTSIPHVFSLLPFSAHGKRILLKHEQGIGDELFFLRFALQLRHVAEWVGYKSTRKVHTLIERSGCVDQVLSPTMTAPPVDLTIPVGDLPLLMGCDSIDRIPGSIRFSATERAVAEIRQRFEELGLRSQRVLGITWRGGSAPVAGKRRNLFKQIDLESMADAVRGWPGAILILQREPRADEIERFRAQVPNPVYDFSACNDDLELMLALLDALDEYVGVSNTNMHLMAALGKKARVLIPFPAEWRWMASGEASPWFPGYPLYRQLAAGDWRQALNRLAQDLASL